MKSITLLTLLTSLSISAFAADSSITQSYIQLSEQKKLEQDKTWLRLMYAKEKGKSEVEYSGYFLSN